MTDIVSLAAKLATFDETWVPKVVGELNGQYVKVVKCEGEYVWHHHEQEDELFYVLQGRLRILLRDREVALEAGEFFIVPRGAGSIPAGRRTLSDPARSATTNSSAVSVSRTR